MTIKELDKQVGSVRYRMEECRLQDHTGRVCYHLRLESEEEQLFFPDIASTPTQALWIFSLFTDMQISLSEAPYIVEDLLSDSRYLFLEDGQSCGYDASPDAEPG